VTLEAPASAAPTLEKRRGRLRHLAKTAGLETQLAVVGLSGISVHVLDDNFFQPEPGSSAADHLISGLVPFAVLAGAAISYRWLRPGLRATIALVLGVLGIVIGGSEAAYYAPKEGLSGDDYTGLVAVAGGVLLLGLAAATLWRTRRRDDGIAWRYPRRVLLGVAGALAAFFLIFPFALSFGFTHIARTTTARGNLGAPYMTVAFDASDGLRLEGWFVPSKNGATVIVFPGKRGTQKHARLLVRHGYGVLVFDRRGEGESEGDPNALGWGFDRDLKGALTFLRSRGDVDPNRIGGLGLSVGGEALLQTAAETTHLKAVVSEGAGARSAREDTVHVSLKKVPELVVSGVMTAGTALFSNRLPPPNLKNLTGKISPTPVFFIYAEQGAGGEDNNPDYYQAAREPKQIWKITTSHTHGLSARPKEYERRVIGFFDRTLLADRKSQ